MPIGDIRKAIGDIGRTWDTHSDTRMLMRDTRGTWDTHGDINTPMGT